MCAESSDQPFSDYGTMLEIRNIKYFPDGRSAVDTVGGRRFRVVDRDTKDGYNTATVHFIKDEHVAEDLLELQASAPLSHNAV
jgi:Lon protease-like protein